jgi:curved DNA-binding protein CbpA
MAEDFYELLEIPDNANEAWIRRAYDLKRETLGQDKTLDEVQRHAKLAAVEDAFAILSNPATRELYDSDRLKLPELAPARKKRSAFTPARMAIWGTVTLLVTGSTWAYWQYAREHERQRQLEERAAAELAAHARGIEERDKAQRAAIEKISGNIERQQAKQQSAVPARPAGESADNGKSDDSDLARSEMATLNAERARVEKERRAEAARRVREQVGR